MMSNIPDEGHDAKRQRLEPGKVYIHNTAAAAAAAAGPTTDAAAADGVLPEDPDAPYSEAADAGEVSGAASSAAEDCDPHECRQTIRDLRAGMEGVVLLGRVTSSAGCSEQQGRRVMRMHLQASSLPIALMCAMMHMQKYPMFVLFHLQLQTVPCMFQHAGDLSCGINID